MNICKQYIYMYKIPFTIKGVIRDQSQKLRWNFRGAMPRRQALSSLPTAIEPLKKMLKPMAVVPTKPRYG